jgi:hypothetical protein
MAAGAARTEEPSDIVVTPEMINEFVWAAARRKPDTWLG